MTLISWLIIAGAVIVFFALLILVLALRYRKVGPNEATVEECQRRAWCSR
jgi:uncharacterized membrane protein YqiK